MENSNGMLPYFVSGLQPLLLLFITAMCNVAYTAIFWPNYALQPSLFGSDPLLETLLICIFCLANFQKLAWNLLHNWWKHGCRQLSMLLLWRHTAPGEPCNCKSLVCGHFSLFQKRPSCVNSRDRAFHTLRCAWIQVITFFKIQKCEIIGYQYRLRKSLSCIPDFNTCVFLCS